MGFDDVVKRAMAKNAEDRYATAGELGPGRAGARWGEGSQRRARRRARCPASEAPVSAAILAAGKARPAGDRRRHRSWRVRRAVVGSCPADGRRTRAGTAPRSAPRWLHRGPRTGPPCPACRPRARTMPARCSTGRSGRSAASEGSQASSQVEGYDPVIHGWKSAPDLPLRLHHEMVVTYKDEMVVIGGWLPRAETRAACSPTRCSRCATAVGRAAAAARPRAAGAAAVVGDKIVVVGGQADGKLVDSTEVFDGKEWKEGAPIPTPREHLAAASDGKYLYAVGGRRLSSDKNWRRSSATTRRRTPGRSSPTCRPLAADSELRSRAATCLLSAARARPAFRDRRVV